MKKTQHYGLCQWDAEDRILREDFNSDNQKIDETMAALKAGNYFEKLADVTTTQSCQQLDVDLSEVDLTQYDRHHSPDDQNGYRACSLPPAQRSLRYDLQQRRLFRNLLHLL